MQQKKSNLANRVDEWESSQVGLPEGSELIWCELEGVLEAAAGKKRRLTIVRLMLAASLLLLLCTTPFLYRLSISNQKASNTSVSARSNPTISTTAMKKTKPISQSLHQKIRVDQLSQSNTHQLPIHQISLPDLPQITVKEPVMVSAPALSNADAKVVNEQASLSVTEIQSLTATRIQQSTSTTYWRKSTMNKKATNMLPIVHVNDEKRSTLMATETIFDEKPLPNFEAPFPNDTKSKWRITLQSNQHPNTTGIKE